MTDLGRIALAARVFTIAVITPAAVVGGLGWRGVLLVLAIAGTATVISLSRRVPEHLLVLVEGATTGVAVVLVAPSNEVVLPYLATPALLGGIARGLPVTVAVLVVEAGSIAAAWAGGLGDYEPGTSGRVITWLVTGLGLGLLGTFTRRSIARSGIDATYRSALDLIKQLHALSGKLTSGLDPVDLADQVLVIVGEELVVLRAVVAVRDPSGAFSPLRYSEGSIPFSIEDADDLMYRCWQSRRPITGTARIALPIATETESVAVVLADCVNPPDRRAVDRAVERLAPEAVRLNAALLFTAVRESATSEERQRIAREVHDGVAQDVASLGYLIDNIADAATDPQQTDDVARLRKEVTRVVAELRNSVFDLRNEVGATQGLGQSVASYARHIGSHSDLTVHVTLDESTTRLRPKVEAELLRIAQESINNARRHSGGENLWVHCRVQPPYAEIQVVDDGQGLGTGREDSHGLKIMRERADRIGADLEIRSPAVDGRGTRVSIRLD